MKNKIKRILQSLFGYNNYLFIFALYIISTLKFQKRERDFLFFLRMLPERGLILDIGANIGVMTYYFAIKKKESFIYAFEPVAENVKIIRKIVSFFHLKNVRIMEIALGNENKKVEMVIPEHKKVKLHGLSHVMHDSIKEFNEGRKIEVDMKKLDNMDIFSLSKYFINGIKLDVENFEYFVLKGAHLILHRHRPLVYAELWDNENREKCFRLMENIGYDIYIVEKRKLVPFNSKIHKKQNFFFIPED